MYFELKYGLVKFFNNLNMVKSFCSINLKSEMIYLKKLDFILIKYKISINLQFKHINTVSILQ